MNNLFTIVTFIPRLLFKIIFGKTKFYMAITAFKMVMESNQYEGINVYVLTDNQVDDYIKDELYIKDVIPVHLLEIEIEQNELLEGKKIEEIKKVEENKLRKKVKKCV